MTTGISQQSKNFNAKNIKSMLSISHFTLNIFLAMHDSRVVLGHKIRGKHCATTTFWRSDAF